MWRKFCRHIVDIKNDYFDKDRLEDMVDEIIIEDEDADRYINRCGTTIITTKRR